MDRFAALASFRRVVECGGFTGAVAGGASKATISKQVAALEAHLGARLLNRTTRRLSLTEAGRAFYADSVRILDDLAAAETRIGAAQAAPRGTLRINAPLSFGVTRLMALLARYRTRYPQVRVDLALDDRPVDLVADGFDVTLRIAAALEDSPLAQRRIGPIAHVVCAAPAYLAAAGTPRRPSDLTGHAMLVYGRGGMRHDYRFGDIDVQVVPTLRVNNSLAIREALLAGLGIAVTPRFVVHEALEDGRLVSLLDGCRAPVHQLFAIFPPGRALPAKTRAFVDLMVSDRIALTDDIG